MSTEKRNLFEEIKEGFAFLAAERGEKLCDCDEPNETTKAAMLEAREMTEARFGSPEELFAHLDSLSLAANSVSEAKGCPMQTICPPDDWANFDEKEDDESRNIENQKPVSDEVENAANIKGIDWNAFIRETMKAKSMEIIAENVKAVSQEVV